VNVIVENLDLFVSGYWRSLQICLYGLLGSLALGTIIATFRVSPLPSLRAAGASWVMVFRNCPLTVVLFFCAFGLPEVGINGSYWAFGITALILYTSAFVCEAIRSGINAVAPGQAEAARSLGLTFAQSLRKIIVPQALRTVVPPLGSVVIGMFKNSAIVGAFGVGGDLFSLSDRLTAGQGHAALPVLVGVLIGYLAITLPAGAALAFVERKVAIAR
jgi:glutamate transport system permease protein